MSYIIMKYDDLLPETFNDFNQVAQYSIQHDLPVSMGVIGRGLENSNTLYKDNLKFWMQNNIELWNHGYYHTLAEFSSATYQQQCQSIADTQRLMKSELGMAASTFGSPHNNSTETTICALHHTAPEITNYLFAVDGSRISNARQLLIRCDMETTTGVIDFDFLKKNYKALEGYPYMVIQGHPSFWKQKDFVLNQQVMQYLHNEGNCFVTPNMLPCLAIEEELEENQLQYIEDIIAFTKIHKKIALYGAGEIGRELYRFLCSKNILPEMFVISDGQEWNEKVICGIPVVKMSQLLEVGRDYGVLLALMPKFHPEIIKVLEDKKIDYFHFMDENRYIYFINYIRKIISIS
ncbi:MAG: DUF2334 domain-containing protein [Lachnospiraceae bacterium]|nr:DUF2334 domain-containing protein [Lachnospiraceae bacterium]